MFASFSVSNGSNSARDREKTVEQNKSQKRALYFPYLRKAPLDQFDPKVALVGDLHDVITSAKFQIEIFTGYDFTGGRIFDFPIHFCM